MPRKLRVAKRDLRDLTGLRVGLYCRVSQADRNNPDPREKSTTDQEAVGRKWAEQVGATIVEVYSDEGISASRFTRKQRDEFDRMLADVEAGKLDAIWFWEASRLSRRPSEFHSLQELCRDHGVVWINQDRIVDPGDYRDMLQSGILAIVDATSSEQTSERVRRGKKSTALAGKPGSGSTPYGYVRTYDQTTRKLIAQKPDVWDGEDRAVEDSPAWVVREIFRRIAAGDSLNAIARDLEDRGIPTPRNGSPGGKYGWRPNKVRSIANNPVYIARQKYQGEVIELPEGVETVWPALVDDETWWTVHRILTDPARKTTRPSAAKSLLSFLAMCATCGGPLGCTPHGRGAGHRHYHCVHRGCTGIKAAILEEYVEEVMVRWLSDPGVFAELTRVDDSAVANQARADAAQARAELAEWQRLAEAGEISPAGYASAEKGLLARIGEAEQRAQESTVPPVLRGRIGPEAEAKWNRAELDIKRQIIQVVVDITVKPTGLKGGQARWHGPTVDQRVEWRWLLGPDAD